MAGTSDDDAHAATIAPAAVDPSGATMASGQGTLDPGQGTLASISGAARAKRGSVPPGDVAELEPVDPRSYIRGKTLATGGMGRIVAAHDRRLGRQVALKEVLVANPELRRRFTREVKLTARLQHPNIITVHEAGTWPDGEPFFAMKLVAGRSLDKVIAEKTTLEARLALLPSVIAVADALAFAHRERVIHRDLKPANVLVGDFGETVVIDWGLAKDLAATEAGEAGEVVLDAVGPYRSATAGDSTETAFGAVLGTPAYMPPEQARGEHVDERADVYALGALLYHVLSGRAPVVGPSVEAVLASVITEPVPAVRTLEPRIPIELDTIIAKAMAPEPADRYATAVTLAEDLRRFQTGQLVGAHHYTSWQLVQRWIRRRRTPLAVAAVALVVLVIGGAYSVLEVLHERDNANTNANQADENATLAKQREREAADSLDALLVEQGRRESLAAHPLRALALLREALRHAGTKPSHELEFLLGRVAPFASTVAVRFEANVTTAKLSPDGQHVVTGSGDGHLRVWSATSGKLESDHELGEPGVPMTIGPSAAVACSVTRTRRRS